MNFLKQFKWLLVGLVFVFTIGVLAYDNLVIHPRLTQASINIYNNQGEDKLTKQEEQAIIFGSITEDTDPRYLHHFYNPETGEGLKNSFSSAKEWAFYQPSSTGDYSVGTILKNYQNGNLRRAYEGVGHILHLVQDMSVPAHTRDDAHGNGDPFEEWAEKHGQVDVSQAEFIEINNIEQAFDELSLYSHDNFFSKDTVSNLNIEDKIIEKIDKKIGNENHQYLICEDSNKKEFICLREVQTPTLSYYKIDEMLVHQDYWKMLYPKAVGYSAGVIDYFQKEFAKIDQEKKQEKLSFWQKIKNSLGDFSNNVRYGWGDRIFYYSLAFDSIFNKPSDANEDQQDSWQKFADNFSDSEILGEKKEEIEEPQPPETDNQNQTQEEPIKIASVIDGDTFVLENGEKVRYIGIDAPELGKPGPEDDECLAWMARLRNMQLLGSGEVTLVKDPEVDEDKYGRLLRYVYVNDVFVNEIMAREGLAEEFFCQPGWENCPVTVDKQKENIIKRASQGAQEASRGIFGNACLLEKEKEDEDSSSKQESLPDNKKGEENNEQEGKEKTNNFFFSNGDEDSVGINTFIISYPKSISTSSQAEFDFKSSEDNAGFECNLDNAGWMECDKKFSQAELVDGIHNLSVRSYFDEEKDATPAEFNWLIDTLTPTSSVSELAEEQADIGFKVSWQGGDYGGEQGSGLAGFDIQYQVGSSAESEQGDWQDWIIATTSTSSVFVIEELVGENICFRSRAFDYAGNLENWPESADTCTHLIDPEVPQLDSFSLSSLTSTSTAYTASTTVGLNYEISNQEFVDAYLFSSSSTTPEADNINWATSTPNYFTLSSGDGQKEVYFWVKHHENEITYLGSANIVLDTEAPQTPTITNIIPQDGIYWVATGTSLLAGEKEQGVDTIFINNQAYDFISSSTDWSLMYEFGFTGDGLEEEEMARADFWACVVIVPSIPSFQQETLNFQAQDKAGNLSDIVSYDFQMDTYEPIITDFDALSDSADGYVYLSVNGYDSYKGGYMGGSGIKEYKFEYKELEGDWQSLPVSDWESEEYNHRAILSAGDYLVRAIAYDWVENISDFSEEINISSNPRPVLSEVYGGGGNSGSYWQNDFIEIYNPTDNNISLEGWSVQYAPSESSSWSVTELSGDILAHGFYLIKEHQGSGGEAVLPTSDASGSTNLAAGSGKIALVSNTESITGLADEDVIDFVGYGDANEFEGEAGAPEASNTSSIERKASQSSTAESMDVGGEEEFDGNGYDSNENSGDWLSRNLPQPQNTASSTE